MTDVFLSYSRQDDEPFVRRLYDDLIAKGISVWWDRVSMPSRALSFLQEIRDAVDDCQRLIAVVGPNAVRSPYVLAEWNHARLFATAFVPVLRGATYELLSHHLRAFHGLDFSSDDDYPNALKRLLGILAVPVAPLRPLYGVPALPPHFVPREDVLNDLVASVRPDRERPVTVPFSEQITAIQGMPGAGKSVMAAAFSRTFDTRRFFQDGVVWLRIGQQPDAAPGQQPDVSPQMRLLADALGDNPARYPDVASGRNHLPTLLSDKKCLLVLDDVWDLASVEPFLNALGPGCRMLVTTRDAGLAAALGARTISLEVSGSEAEQAGMSLLAGWVGESIQAHWQDARAVARMCGNLPHALALCGAMASEGTPWDDLLGALREADLGFLEKGLPNYKFTTLLTSLAVSVDALARSNPQSAARYRELAAFPRQTRVPERAVLTLWQSANGLNDRSARQLLIALRNRALLHYDDRAPAKPVSLHDLNYDYLIAALESPRALHRRFVEAYRRQCPDGWHSGPNDGYFFEHLPHHLAQAAYSDELQALLADFRWLQAKLAVTSTSRVLADYDLCRDSAELRLVRSALRLSAHILAADPGQLAAQLWGRLRPEQGQSVRNLLDHARPAKPGPWLRPIIATLRSPTDSLELTLQGHVGEILAVAVTPDGNRAVSASADGTLKIWELGTGALEDTLSGHGGPVNTVALTPGGDYAVSGSDDTTLRIWSLETRGQRTLAGHRNPVNAVAVSPDGRWALSASSDQTLKIWDLQAGTEVGTLSGHTAPVLSVALTSDGRHVVSGSGDGTLKIWDLTTRTAIHTWIGHSRGVIVLALTPNGHWLISGSADQTLKRWSLSTAKLEKDLTVKLNPFSRGIAVTPDGTRLVFPVWDEFAVCLLESGSVERTFSGHSLRVWTVALTPDGKRIVSGSQDHNLKVWSLAPRISDSTPTGHTDWVNDLAVTPDGRQVISASGDATLKLWDMTSGALVKTLAGHTGGIDHVATTADGTRAVSASRDGTVRVWGLPSGRLQHTLARPRRSVTDVSLTPDSTRVVWASDDGTLTVSMLESGETERALSDHSSPINRIAMASDGSFVVTASDDASLKVWTLPAGTLERTLTGHTTEISKRRRQGGISSLVVTPDNRRIISASFDQTLRVWDLGTRSAPPLTLSNDTMIWALAPLSDGVHLLSGSWEGALKLWDLETGRVERSFAGHGSGIVDLWLVPRKSRAVSASWDNTVKLWDLETGALIAGFTGDGRIRSCAAAPDGLIIVAGEEASGAVHFLQLASI